MPKGNKENKIHPNVKGRVVPASNEAEQAVLGCVLIDEYAPNEIMAELMPEDFYSRSHQLIFEAMKNIYSDNKPVELVTLVQELDKMGCLETVGGLSYISTLTDIVPSAANSKYYVDIVKQTKTRRKTIETANRIINSAYTGEEDCVEFAEREVFSLGEGNVRSTLAPISQGVSEAVDRMQKIQEDPLYYKGIPTGFKRLDDLINGFQQGDLVIIAARPGQGKTSIGMNFIQYAAETKVKTLTGDRPLHAAVFSLEMPAMQLARRMLCSVAKVNMTDVNSGRISDSEWQRLTIAKGKLDKLHIYIDDTSNTSPMDIISKCRKLAKERALDIIMIDYLQLMNAGKRVENRQQEISEITRSLKIAAKELKVPILLLSQLSRKVEDRKDKKPEMSDLRESGAIEQDADIIMFLYRQYSDADREVSEDVRNKVQLIVAKHRNGETGTVDLRWRGSYVSFEDDSAPSQAGMQNAPSSSTSEEHSSEEEITLVPDGKDSVIDDVRLKQINDVSPKSDDTFI